MEKRGMSSSLIMALYSSRYCLSNFRKKLSSIQKMPITINDIHEDASTFVATADDLKIASNAATIVTVHPLIMKEFLFIRVITSWMNSRCFIVSELMFSPLEFNIVQLIKRVLRRCVNLFPVF